MNAAETLYNPRLTQAVWSCTRTSRSSAEGQHLQTLQEFLLDSSTVDATFLTIIGRARAEPLSAGVWLKCAELLKRYLPRFGASPSTLQEIEAFCSDCLASKNESQPGLLSSLQFLRALVAQQAGVRTPARTLFRQADEAEAGSEIHHADGTPPRGLHDRMSDQQACPTSNSRHGLQCLSDASLGTGLVTDMLTFGWLSEAQDENYSLDSSAAFAPSLAVVSQPGAFSSKSADGLSSDALTGGTLKVQHQLSKIAALHQAHGRHGAYLPDARSSEKAKKRQQRISYSDSEAAALLLDEKDIEAILESVCGPSTLPDISLDVAKANGDSSSSHAEDPDMCCSLLSHLLLDLWKRAGPGTSFTLALVLLRRLLRAEKSETQRRAFDVLYNMSLHCELLPSSSRDTASPSEQGLDVDLATVFSDESADRIKSSLLTGNEQTMQIQSWLRMLLFELLQVLAQRKVASEELWQAAIGCLCHLCSCGGDLKREWVQPMPPRAAAAMLRCASQFHWPDSLHTQLVRVATNLLYVGDDIHLEDRKGSSQQPESGMDNGDSILDSASDGGLSFKTAATESEPAAPLTCSHAGLRLSLTRLQAFGGVEEVARQFRDAASREARRNMLCILLECIIARLCCKELPEDAADDTTLVLESPEDALLVCRILAASDVADSLSAAFTCGLPGFAHPIASSLSLPGSMQEDDAERVQAVVRLVLEQMEALAVSTAAGELTPALLPALTNTLAAAGSASAASQGVTGVWACLTDLFCSPDPRSSQLADSWLLRLLVAAAERHLEEVQGDGIIALLPSAPHSTCDSIGLQQEQLTDVLQHIICKATPAVNTAARLVRVAWRLLLVVKQRCTLTHSFSMELTSPPISPPFLRSLRGAARSICTPRPSAGKEGSGSGHKRDPSMDAALRRLRLSDETYYSASASASADQEGPPMPPASATAERTASRFASEPAASSGDASDDDGAADAQPTEGEEGSEAAEAADEAGILAPEAGSGVGLGLAARGDTAKQSVKGDAHAEGVSDAEPVMRNAGSRNVLVSEEGEQFGSVWHSYSAAQLSLATQAVLVDWLLDTPDMCRQEAFLEMGRLLITSLVLPSPASHSPADASTLHKSAAGASNAAVESPLSSASEENSVGTVTAFLAGTVGVPHDLLGSVSPVMLALIFQNLPQAASSTDWSSATEQDVRAAVLLLLAARCKGSLDDTAAISGSSFFVRVLNDADPRVRHIAASFLQAHFMASQPRAYRRGLRQLVMQAQQNAEDRLCNAFMQVSTLLDMRLVDPAA